MSNKIYLGSRLAELEIGEPSLPVSKVILNVDSETCFIAGDDTGSTVEQNCPWATQAMADSVLEKLKGFVYNPYSGIDALLDPAAELGDALTVGGTYGILAQMGRNLDRQGAASVGSPGTDEIEDEYPYKSKQRKQTDRILAKAYSRISKTAEEIRLEVQNEVEGLSSSFTVELDAISAEIVGLENAYSEMELTLDRYAVRIQDAEGNIGELELTATELRSEISGKIDGDYAQTLIDQALDSITLEVSSASGSTTFKLLGGEVELDTTTLNLTVEAVNISGTLKASQINLTGAITWGDLATDAKGEITEAQNAASDAWDIAYESYQASETALDNLELLANGRYSGGSFIDGTNIYAPNLYGDTITLLDSYSRVVGTMSLQYSSSYAFDLSSRLSLRMQAAYGSNAYIGTNGGPSLLLGTVNGRDVCQFGGGALVISTLSYGNSLPSNPATGQVYFLLAEQ